MHKPVRASLLAKAVFVALQVLRQMPPSRASSLPQGFMFGWNEKGDPEVAFLSNGVDQNS
ncbi:hypothetical protein [Pseudomonas sp. McL0111]|uniref:hypothetical protein n=1 Tax=Pseudomonas sp. McL0111 TaxID=3457357 RepID=UPI00403E9F04